MEGANTETSMRALTILIPLGLVGFILFGVALQATPRQRAAQEVAIVAPSAVIATVPLARLPSVETTRRTTTPTPLPPTPVPATLPTRVPASLSQRATAAPPRQTPAGPLRVNCDPAYPEQRTCIPPGPPFKQGCAITDQRLFAVLPPDPQHLDSDKDGIGCEPIA
jgi:hypothetical protein